MTASARVAETVVGPAGWAGRVELDDVVGDAVATVAFWFIHAPGQSPAWDKYGLGVVHLRDVPGQSRPPVRRFPSMTHEVLLVAYDPQRDPQATDPESWSPLHPVNLCEQVALPGDAAAAELLDLCARAVVAGVLWAEAPLAGQREPWRSALAQTASHLRGEGHAS